MVVWHKLFYYLIVTHGYIWRVTLQNKYIKLWLDMFNVTKILLAISMHGFTAILPAW